MVEPIEQVDPATGPEQVPVAVAQAETIDPAARVVLGRNGERTGRTGADPKDTELLITG